MKKSVFLLAIAGIFGFPSAQAQECRKASGQIRLSATGDILVHKALYQQAVKHPSRFQILWGDLIPTLRSADYTVGNLEGPVAPGVVAGGRSVEDVGFIYDDRVYSGTKMVFNYHPYLLEDLKASGFDLVTTANNHSLDRRSLGVDRTIENLQRVGLEFAGTRPGGSAESTARIVRLKGARFGFISCTEATNGIPDSRAQVTMCGSGEVSRLIRELRSRVDGVVVFPHWGDEYVGRPHERQRNWARQWIEDGAVAVIGNHPHVLQTVEWRRTDRGDHALIVYSLGNFVAAQGAFEKRLSAIAHIDFRKTRNGLVVEQFSYTPTLRPNGSVAHRRATGDAAEAVVDQLGSPVCVN